MTELESVELESLRAAHTAELLGLLAMARLSSGNLDGLDELLTSARVRGIESGCVAIQAEIELIVAFYQMAEGRLNEARRTVEQLIEVDPTSEMPSLGGSLTLRLTDVRVRAYDFLANLAGRENQNLLKAQLLRVGLQALDVSQRDHYVEAAVLTNLAVVGAEVDDLEAYEFVSARLDALKFSNFTQKFEFEIHRAVGIGNAMRGNHLGAMRSFRNAADVAPSIATQIKAVVDRSMLARELGENLSSDDEIDYALRLATRVDWKNEKGTEIFALLALARCLADRDMKEARRIFDLYKTCKRNVSFLNYANKDLGILARELHVEALIARREGNLPRAIQQSVDALDYFKQIGYAWRAAEVAADLFEMTGERSYLEYATVYAEKIPQSHLARRVRALATTADTPTRDAIAR